MERGALVISIDTELAWGEAHKRDGNVAGHHFDRERDVIERILEVFTRHEIPATWAMVGHLFLDRCDGKHDVEQPAYDWLDGDWLDIDPGSDVAAAPHYYGRDIVERVLACPVPQELGSHSFSHVIADDPGCTPEVFASELAAAQAVADPLGVELRSFVYPRNAVAHLDTLAAAGFTGYRGRRPTGTVVHPTREDGGLWNIPQTYLFAPVTAHRRLPPALWVRRPIVRLRKAASTRSLFHLWFHPYNVTADPDRAIACLDLICRSAARLRARGRLDTLTMADLAARLGS